jgi:hypothetical protein
MVDIPVVIALFDDDGFVVVPMITVAYDVTVAIPVTISVPLSNRYANRADTYPNLFRSSRYRAANSGHGGDHYDIPNHCILLSLLNSGRPIPRRQDRSPIAGPLKWEEQLKVMGEAPKGPTLVTAAEP